MEVRHILADGRKIESLEGFLLKPENAQEFYKVMEKIIKTRGNRNEQN